jgi:hypothetical protein
MGSWERKPNEGSKSAFVRWVDENMLRERKLTCTSIELDAQCAVLHAFTSESDRSRAGQTCGIVYAWGNSRAEDLAEAGRRLGRGEVSVHIRDLIESFPAGLASYLEEAAQSPDRL